MQNMGNGSYNGALENMSLKAAGRDSATDQAEGDGDDASPIKPYGMTGVSNGDYSARASETNDQPRRKG